ncbi:hypothetical protein QWA68_015191 [Fusarium oxysporum]|nr:hypothetical protein QWA68_015191 [Fusarium oxysporum]
MDSREATQFRNKTVPLYLPIADGPRRGLKQMLPIIIYNYIYRRWFQPYRTSIYQGQFIIKIIHPDHQVLTSDLDSAVSLAMRMHTMINDRLDSIEAEPFYTTLPLFIAIMIVVTGQLYPTCGILRNITKMSVLVMATGEQGGLSASITFDSIANGAKPICVGGLNGVETDLETAIEFFMSLEKRKEASFGPQPDPVAALGSPACSPRQGRYKQSRSYADRLRWMGDTIVGPRSEWVDTEEYKRWASGGAYVDAGMMT